MRHRAACGALFAGAFAIAVPGAARAAASKAVLSQMIDAINSSESANIDLSGVNQQFQKFDSDVKSCSGLPGGSGVTIPQPDTSQSDTKTLDYQKAMTTNAAAGTSAGTAASSAEDVRSKLSSARDKLKSDVIDRLKQDVQNLSAVTKANKSYDDLAQQAQSAGVPTPGQPDKQPYPSSGQQTDLSGIDGPVTSAVNSAKSAVQQYQTSQQPSDLSSAQNAVQQALSAVNSMRQKAAGEVGYLDKTMRDYMQQLRDIKQSALQVVSGAGSSTAQEGNGDVNQQTKTAAGLFSKNNATASVANCAIGAILKDVGPDDQQ